MKKTKCKKNLVWEKWRTHFTCRSESKAAHLCLTCATSGSSSTISFLPKGNVLVIISPICFQSTFHFFISLPMADMTRSLWALPSGKSGRKFTSDFLAPFSLLERVRTEVHVLSLSSEHPATRRFCWKLPILNFKLNFQQNHPWNDPGSFRQECLMMRAWVTW